MHEKGWGRGVTLKIKSKVGSIVVIPNFPLLFSMCYYCNLVFLFCLFTFKKTPIKEKFIDLHLLI